MLFVFAVFILLAAAQDFWPLESHHRHFANPNPDFLALSRISPRVRVRVSVSIVYRIATGGYSWIWPIFLQNTLQKAWQIFRIGTVLYAEGL